MAKTYSGDAHWRDASRSARFYFLDAYSVFPILIWLLHARTWTAELAAVLIIFLAILERFKFTLPVFRRWFRSYLAGPYRVSKPWWGL